MATLQNSTNRPWSICPETIGRLAIPRWSELRDPVSRPLRTEEWSVTLLIRPTRSPSTGLGSYLWPPRPLPRQSAPRETVLSSGQGAHPGAARRVSSPSTHRVHFLPGDPSMEVLDRALSGRTLCLSNGRLESYLPHCRARCSTSYWRSFETITCLGEATAVRHAPCEICAQLPLRLGDGMLMRRVPCKMPFICVSISGIFYFVSANHEIPVGTSTSSWTALIRPARRNVTRLHSGPGSWCCAVPCVPTPDSPPWYAP